MSELRKGEGARGWFKLLTHGEAEYYNVPVIAEEEHVKAHIRKLKVEKCVASFFLDSLKIFRKLPRFSQR